MLCNDQRAQPMVPEPPSRRRLLGYARHGCYRHGNKQNNIPMGSPRSSTMRRMSRAQGVALAAVYGAALVQVSLRLQGSLHSRQRRTRSISTQVSLKHAPPAM